MLCSMLIVLGVQWQALWILPVQFVALTATTYRARRALFDETWSFWRYLSWRLRFHVGMFGLWWFVALIPVLLAQGSPHTTWWLSVLATAIGLAWHHWSGRVLLILIGASRLQRPDLDGHFQRVFAAARVPVPDLWRAGAAGGRLANAFAMVTLGQRGVLFFDSLLEQLPADEVTSILAHEVAHLEQFHQRRLLTMYAVTAVLILLLVTGSAVVDALAPGFESWAWLVSIAGVFGAMWLRARRMQAHETDADLRAIELCGDPDALIRGLIRIYEINHIPRRWSAVAEEHATHPSLARRIRTIRERTAAPDVQPEPLARVVVPSSEAGRCAVIDHNRVGFLWIDGELGDPASMLDRANRVEMAAYDQLSELRLSAKGGAIELIAVHRRARRWSMPIDEADAARVQATLDRIDHLVVAPAPVRDYDSFTQRTAALIVMLVAATFSAIGAVLVPALLALRRPQRPIVMALVAALAGTAIASVNEPDVSLVGIALLGILTLGVLWTVRRRPQQEPQPDAPLWVWIERVSLLIPVVTGLIFAAANAQDLFGLHAAIRDRAWFTAALAAMAVFYMVQTGPRVTRRAGLSVAAVATASLIIGSPWFLLHAVGDPLVAAMPSFSEKPLPATADAQHAVDGAFSSVRVTPSGNHVLLFGQYDQHTIDVNGEGESAPQPQRFIAAGFDGWSREIRAFDIAVIDDHRLLVLDRADGSSHVRAEDLRTGQTLWTLALPNIDLSAVQATPDGRWRAFARRGRQFERIDGRVGTSPVRSTRWTVTADRDSYMDTPRNDGGSVALAVASQWQEPTLGSLLRDWRERTRLLRIDPAGTTELASSHLRVDCSAPPMDVTGYVCLSFDGRVSRFWRIDLLNGGFVPIAETNHMIWKAWQPSQQRIAGIANGRPLLADLNSQTLVTLIPDTYCWAQDVGVAGDVVVSLCGNGATTTVMQYRVRLE
jgi:Zn-dependent protease with chaperone function